MYTEATFKLKHLNHGLEMPSLFQSQSSGEVLNDNNPAHAAKMSAKAQNAKAYVLLATLVEGKRLVCAFFRLNPLHTTSAVPNAAC